MKLQITERKIVKRLYQMFYDLHRILEKEGISYWAVGGTALGAIRHRGIIPWDDDIDIGVDKRDMNRVGSLTKTLKLCGYGLVKVWTGYKVFPLDVALTDGFTYSFPNIDIFAYEMKGSKIRMAKKSCRKMWPKEAFRIEDLYPLRKYRFGEFHIWGPYKCETYLSRIYGKRWNIEAYREYDHEKEEEVEKIIVKLTDRDKKPAKPTSVRKRACIKD